VFCVDVNVLIDAHRHDQPGHDVVSAWLDAARRGREPLGVPSVTASGFLRIVTHPRVFREPTPTPMAVDFIERLLRSPAAQTMTPGDRHVEIFTSYCLDLALKGNDIPDAYLAALAVEQGATFVTGDRGFRRFRDLRVLRPGES
jgi:toxin-antitoxin system PIN domain toxin